MCNLQKQDDLQVTCREFTDFNTEKVEYVVIVRNISGQAVAAAVGEDKENVKSVLLSECLLRRK